jgi:uncharacterized membrane protein YqiK
MEENMTTTEQLADAAATAEAKTSAQEVKEAETAKPTPDKTFSQADVDKMITARLERERKKYEAEKEEAAKLAKMNAEQKAEYAAKKREEDLTAREKAIQEKELRYTALGILEENKLPSQLIDCLNLSSADSCNAGIEALKKAWPAAITAAVDARLKSDPPKYSGGNPGTDAFLAEFDL